MDIRKMCLSLMLCGVLAGCGSIDNDVEENFQAQSQAFDIKLNESVSVPVRDTHDSLSANNVKTAVSENQKKQQQQKQQEQQKQQTQQEETPQHTNTGKPAPTVPNDSVWDALAQCEAGGDWANSSNGTYFGGIQIHPQTWAGYGGTEYAPQAHLATREQQIAIGEKILAEQGWGAWPACSAQLELR